MIETVSVLFGTIVAGGETVEKKTNGQEVSEAHFRMFYDETYDELKRFVATKCEDIQDISDILQETYLAYYRLILKRGTDYADSPRAVLYSIAKRQIFRLYSLKRKLSVFVPLLHENESGETYCSAEEEDTYHMEDEVIDRMEAERIWKELAKYPAETRKIFYLYYSCGMSHTKIAETMGMNVSSVKNRIYRTIAEIRRKEK